MNEEQRLREQTQVLTDDMDDFVDGIESIEGEISKGKPQLFWYLRYLAKLELRIKDLEDA